MLFPKTTLRHVSTIMTAGMTAGAVRTLIIHQRPRRSRLAGRGRANGFVSRTRCSDGRTAS